MESSSLYQALWYVSTLAALLVLLRIVREGLLHTLPYRAFAGMLCFVILRDSVLSFAGDYRSHTYALLWSASLIPLLVLQSVAAVQTYRAIANLYPKIGGFAIRLFRGALLATAGGCCLGLPFELRHISGIEASVRTMFLLDRWLNSLMAGGLILAVAYLARFPRPLKVLPQNLVLHTSLLCAYFTAYSIVPFVLNLVPLGAGQWVQVSFLGTMIALYSVWALRISREGERIEEWPRIDERLLEQIIERNRALLQFGSSLAESALRQATGRR